MKGLRMLTIHKPADSKNQPHLWVIIDDAGMHVCDGCKLIPEAREKQAEIMHAMVDAYNASVNRRKFKAGIYSPKGTRAT